MKILMSCVKKDMKKECVADKMTSDIAKWKQAIYCANPK